MNRDVWFTGGVNGSRKRAVLLCWNKRRGSRFALKLRTHTLTSGRRLYTVPRSTKLSPSRILRLEEILYVLDHYAGTRTPAAVS